MYSELIGKHDGHAIPPELKTHLIRFHKIAEKAAEEVAETFIKNAKYTGAANEHGILNYKQAHSKVSDSSVEYAEVVTEERSKNGNGGMVNYVDTRPESTPQLLLPEIPNAENIKIPLSEKKVAYLAYPPNLKKKDIEILRKQLDLLELIAE